jgi:hypothetical protein
MQDEKVLVRGLLRMLLTVWSKMMSVWVLKVGQPGNFPYMAARFYAYAIMSTLNCYKIKIWNGWKVSTILYVMTCTPVVSGKPQSGNQEYRAILQP